MIGCPDPMLLDDFMADRLAGDAERAVIDHLESCGHCQALLDEANRPTQKASTPADPPLPESVRAFLMASDVVVPKRPRPQLPVEPPNIPGYEILERLGVGATGVVYKARNQRLNRLVALKMLADDAASPSRDGLIQVEAEILAKLDHPNIVAIFDVGDADGVSYLALELVEGGTLATRLRAGRMAPKEAAALVETLATACHAAHTQGIVHRDLKPANVLMHAGVPKIVDFGLAKRLGGELGSSITGEVKGTPSYMAPEQASGRMSEVGPATDVHALGVMLYEMLTGALPFPGPSLLETLEQVRGSEPMSMRQRRPDLPRDLETICRKCLEKNPHRRYASAAALAEELHRFRAGEPILARPVGIVEATWRWCLRHPSEASLSAALALGLIVGLAVVSWKWRGEVAARADADSSREMAEQNLYFSQTGLALSAVGNGDYDLANQILDRVAPSPGRPDRRGWEWHYVRRQTRPELLRLEGHSGAVQCVAFSADGRWLVSAGGGNLFFNNPGQTRQPGEAILWDASTGERLRTLSGHPHIVGRVAISPDRHHLATASMDGKIVLWNADTGELRRTWNVGACKIGVALGFSPDSRRLLLPGPDRTSEIRDVSTGELILSLPGYNAAFSPDGATVALAVPSGGAQLLDASTGRLRRSFPSPLENVDVIQLAFSPDGRQLSVADYFHGRVDLHDVDSDNPPNRLAGDPFTVFGIAFHPTRPLAATADIRYLLRLWPLPQGKAVDIVGHTQGIRAVAFAANGRHIATGSDDGIVRLTRFDMNPRYEHHRLGEEPAAIAFSADGRELHCAFRGGIRNRPGHITTIADPVAPPRDRTLDVTSRHIWPRKDFQFSPDGKYLAAPMDEPGFLATWDVDTLTIRHRLAVPTSAKIAAVAWSPDGAELAAAMFDATRPPGERCELQIWTVATGALRQTIPAGDDAPSSLAWRPGTRGFALGTVSGIVLFDADAGTRTVLLRGSGRISSVAYDSTGRRLAATELQGKAVRLFRRPGLEEPIHLAGPDTPCSVLFSPDGTRLFAAGYSSHVHVWDANTGQDAVILRGLPTNAGTQGANPLLAISPDGRRLASNNWDYSLFIREAGPVLP